MLFGEEDAIKSAGDFNFSTGVRERDLAELNKVGGETLGNW